MSIEAEDEILQDFLVEAGEILEQLGEQLVELERRATDGDLLNAVFRGFHTIKGGASFLGLDPLVELCHAAEDVFNVLRQGERTVDADLMDAVLQGLDVVTGMFETLRGREMPSPADPALVGRLRGLATPGEAPSAPLAQASSPPEAVAAAPGADEITDAEFEVLLDALEEKRQPPGDGPTPADAGPKAAGDEMGDDEFERLLDELHGQGRGPVSAGPADAPAAAAQGASVSAGEATMGAPGTPAPQAVEAPAAAPAAHPEPQAAEVSGASAQRAATAGETTVRVDTGILDSIMNMVGELVLVRNRLVTLEQNSGARGDEESAKAVAHLDLVTANLQNEVMKTRMQPIKKVFGRFPRVVRDLARSLEKEVSLELRGEETDLDKNLVDALADPLVHLVRNAVDHGIEPPEERAAAGKPRVGTVTLSARQEGDQILLTIEDDGKGMDPERLREKAVEKGIMDAEAAARLDRGDCFDLIFAPGFSTKAEISDVSGRGVGMDVVKTRISALNGTIRVESEPGTGTRIAMKVPLTLAILPTLMVILGKQIFALPLVNVSEIFNLDLSRTNMVDGRRVVVVRDKPLPLFFLAQWLVDGALPDYREREAFVVVVGVGTQRFGFVVDQLIGQEEVVIKPLGALLHGTAGLAGATITGDGRIALILDVPSLMQAYAR
jgi:two-component system chemotaxis sensor kinase CheA